MDSTGYIIVIIVILAAFFVFLYLNSQDTKKREEERRAQILAHNGQWSAEIIQLLIDKKIAVSMTQEMVLLSWGKPSTIDQKEITAKSNKIRWIYGTPRQGARYVWFADAKVTKIKA